MVGTPVEGYEGWYMRFAGGGTMYELDLAEGSNGGFILAVDAGALFGQSLWMGGRFAWQHGDNGPVVDLSDAGYVVEIFDVVFDMSATIPSQTGVLLGVRGGVSWEYTNLWNPRGGGSGLISFGSGGGKEKSTISWPSVTGVVELYSGGQFHITDKIVPFFRVGYSFRDFGRVQAQPKMSDPPDLDLDFSGWFVEVGICGIQRPTQKR